MKDIGISRPPVPFHRDPRVTLYHGNCCDVLPFLAGIDGVVSHVGRYKAEYVKALAAAPRVSFQEDLAWHGDQWLFFSRWLTLCQTAGARWFILSVDTDWLPSLLRVLRVIGVTVDAVERISADGWRVRGNADQIRWAGATVVDPFCRDGAVLEAVQLRDVGHVVGIDANLDRLTACREACLAMRREA